MLEESTGVRDVVSSLLSEHFKTTLYLPVLDKMLSELERGLKTKPYVHESSSSLCPTVIPFSGLKTICPSC